MNDCKRFEKLLWEYDKISKTDRSELESHLGHCARCRQAAKTIEAIRLSAENDRKTLEMFDADGFDASILAGVRMRSRASKTIPEAGRQYDMRLVFSFVAAAAVVLFMIKLMSDLGPIDTGKMSGPAFEQSDGRRIINIQLRRRESEVLPKRLATPPALAQTTEAFSILTGPVTAPSPESVNIDAVFVSSDSVPMEKQMQAASLAEIYADTGAIQVVAPEVSVMITSEKMPRPIHVELPEYPIWARKRGLSATVWLKAKVLENGSVDETQILSCDNPGVGFEESAAEAARKSQFLPASANGIDYSIWIIYPVRFIFKNQD